MTSRLVSVSSVSRGAGRFDAGIVWQSTAAYSAVWPTLSSMFDVGAALDQRAGDVEVAVDEREDQRRVAVGIDDVDVGAGVEQHLGAVDAAFARGEQQRRQPARRQPLVARLLACAAAPRR